MYFWNAQFRSRLSDEIAYDVIWALMSYSLENTNASTEAET